MTRIQQWIAGTVVAVLAIAAAGWFVAIAPQSHKASNLVAQAVTQEQDNVVARNNLARLTTQMTKVPAEQAEVAAIAQKIPADPGLPSYVRNLTAAAAKTGVELVSIAPGIPATVVVPAATVAPAAGASASATPTAAATPVAAPAAPAASLQAISIGVVAQGGYYQLEEFTKALEGLNRSTVLTAVNIAPAPALKAAAASGTSTATSATAWKSLQATITLSVFMNSSSTFTPVAVPTTAPSGAVGSPGAPTSVTTVTPPAVPSASASH
jgi:Tfp pilus assembly protein PilO